MDRIHDRIAVKSRAEHLLRSLQHRPVLNQLTLTVRHLRQPAAQRPCIHSKNRRSGKTENMIPLKLMNDRLMHIAKLAAMAFIKDEYHTLLIHRQRTRLIHKPTQLLNRRDDNLRGRIGQLCFKLSRTGRRVSSSLFKTVIFPHCLCVQIFSVYDKKNFVHIRPLRKQPCAFETGQSLSGTRRVPDIPAGINTALDMIVDRPSDLTGHALTSCNLIRTHHSHDIINTENTVFRDDIQQCHAAEKGLREINQIRNPMIFGVCPPGCKLESLMGMYSSVTDCVGIILCMRAIGNHKDLHILIKT